jgi:ectoine hydroxylase-related dioxygenase (phytanoyl-CoA dioxygenase family)
MTISNNQKFEFDVQGYLHLRQALSQAEVAEYLSWAEQIQNADINALNGDQPEQIKSQLNRPISRVIDADTRFARFLDHPVVEPFLVEFLGEGYRHIDNELYYTYPDYAGGRWHRGVQAHPTSHVVEGRFICPMVKIFYCLTDVGPDQGEFVVIPGSHHSFFKIDLDRVDLPGQHIFNDVKAGDIVIFSEALMHNGRPNPSQKTRKTIIVNFGRQDAGPWPGYTPKAETLAAVTPRQRAILSNSQAVWQEPELAAV